MKSILTFVTAMFIALVISGCAGSHGNMQKHEQMKSCKCDMKKQDMKSCKCASMKDKKMKSCKCADMKKDASCSVGKCGADMKSKKSSMSCGAGKCGSGMKKKIVF